MARPEKPIDENLLLSMFLKGVKTEEIAMIFGVTKQTVYRRLNKHGEFKRDFVKDKKI